MPTFLLLLFLLGGAEESLAVDVCTLLKPCNEANSECVTEDGITYNCVCMEGFVGSYPTCTPPDDQTTPPPSSPPPTTTPEQTGNDSPSEVSVDDILGQLQEVLDDLQDVPEPFDDLMPKVHEKLHHLKEEIPKLLELPLEELLPKLRMKMDVLTEFLESFVEENDLPFGNLLELLQMLPGPFQDLQEKLRGVNEKLDHLKELLESFVGNLGPVGALLEIELGKFSDELDLADLIPVILAQLQQKLDGLENLPEQVDTLMPEIRKKLDHLQEELPKLVKMPLDKLIPKLQKKMTKLLDWLENLIDGVDLPFENLNVAFSQIPNPSAKLKEVLDALIDVKENLGKMLEELTISVDLGIALLSPLQKLPDPIQSLEQLLSMLQDAGKRLDVLLGPFEGLLQLLEPLKALTVLKHDIGNILDHLLSLLKLSQSLMDNVEDTSDEVECDSDGDCGPEESCSEEKICLPK